MPNFHNAFGQEFTVNQISGHVDSSDIVLNIQKRRERIFFRSSVSSENALLAYSSVSNLNASDNLSIIDRSLVLVNNQIEDYTEYTLHSDSISFISEVENILITDIFTTALTTQSTVPLFYQHVIPVEHFDSSAGHTIVSLKILDDLFNEVLVAEKYYDYDNGIVYNNLEHNYQASDESFKIYYVQYTVKKSSTEVVAYITLLNNANIYAQATLEDITAAGTLDTDSKTYLVDELSDGSYQFTLPIANDYAYRCTSSSRLKLLYPVAQETSSPWYLRVSNGSFFSTVNSSSYKYHIAEILDQVYTPYAPYKYIQDDVGVVLNKNLVHTSYSKIYVNADESLHFSIFIYDSYDNLKYALTTDTSLHDTRAGTDVDGSTVYYSCFDDDDATYGIRSIDYRWGFIDIQGIDLLETDKVICSYYYEMSDYELTTVNFNPLSNQDILKQGVIVFLIPDTLSSSRTQSVYTLVMNKDGLVTSSDWSLFDNDTGKTTAGKYLFYQDPPTWFTTEYGSTNCENFWETYTVNGNSDTYAYFVLGEAYIRSIVGAQNVDIVDVRQPGGGLNINSTMRDTEDANGCWDIGMIDGSPYPGAGCCLVEVPIEILNGVTASFTSAEIRTIVERHMALGIYPVIRAYGIDPRILTVTPGDGTISITWTHSDTDVYYNIYTALSRKGPFTLQNTTPVQENVTSNFYKVLGLTNHVSYYIFVVGGKYIDGTWTPLAEQIIGEHYPTALGVNTLEFVKCMPGLPRNSNLFSQEFTVTI